MKLIAERTHLLAALKAVGHLADPKNAVPMVGHLRMRAAGSRLFIAATDLDAWAEAEIAAEVEREGMACIPYFQIDRMVQGFAEGSQVFLDAGGELATIKAGRSRYQINILPADEFPAAFEAGDAAAQVDLTAEEAERLLDLPRPAAAKDDKAYAYLDGILLHGPLGDQATLHGVAMNGKVLLGTSIEAPSGAADLPQSTVTGWPSVMLSLQSTSQLLKLSKAGLSLEIGTSVLVARAGGAMPVHYTTRLIGNSFPAYTKIVPEFEGPFVEVNGGAFAAAVRRLADLAGDDKRPIAIEWAEEGDLSLWLDDWAGGVYGVETVEIAAREGMGRTGVQKQYITKVVDAVSSGRLEIWSAGEDKNLRFRALDDPSLIAIIAPLPLRRRPHHGAVFQEEDAA